MEETRRVKCPFCGWSQDDDGHRVEKNGKKEMMRCEDCAGVIPDSVPRTDKIIEVTLPVFKVGARRQPAKRPVVSLPPIIATTRRRSVALRT